MRLVCATLLVALALPAAGLKKETVGEFERYVAAAEERFHLRYDTQHFLWPDELPPAQGVSANREGEIPGLIRPEQRT